MHFLTWIFVFASAIYMVRGDCNTCSKLTNLACVNRTAFTVCYSGTPTLPAYSCPVGSVCTGGNKICELENKPGIDISCNNEMCGQCNEKLAFACSSHNTFQLCLNTNIPIDKNYTCPVGTVCDVYSDNICIPLGPASGSTCSYSSVTATEGPPLTESTTINPVKNPQAYCATKALRGRFDLITDITCKQYINCNLSGGVWYGNIYKCPNPNYFDPKRQMCVSAKPLRCAEPEEVCD